MAHRYNDLAALVAKAHSESPEVAARLLELAVLDQQRVAQEIANKPSGVRMSGMDSPISPEPLESLLARAAVEISRQNERRRTLKGQVMQAWRDADAAHVLAGAARERAYSAAQRDFNAEAEAVSNSLTEAEMYYREAMQHCSRGAALAEMARVAAYEASR